MREVSMSTRTAGSATSASRQCPPLRTPIRRFSCTASWTAWTTCSVEPTRRTKSGVPRNRLLYPL